MAARRESTLDASDARDERLLAGRRFDELVAAYYEIIVQGCWLRIRDRSDALDVANDVVVRLLYQLGRGKRFSVPFRVVVHKRIDWEVKRFFGRRTRERLRRADLDEAAEPWREEDSILGILDRDEVARLLERLPERDREILELVYFDDLSIARVAERLGITRNAADQRLFRGRLRGAQPRPCFGQRL